MKSKLTMTVAALAIIFSAGLQADMALATKSGCMACHKADMKLVGPSLKEIAEKYKGQNATDSLVAKVKSGGAGVWGQIPMPPNAHVPEGDIKTVVNWFLSH